MLYNCIAIVMTNRNQESSGSTTEAFGDDVSVLCWDVLIPQGLPPSLIGSDPAVWDALAEVRRMRLQTLIILLSLIIPAYSTILLYKLPSFPVN